MGKKSKKTTRAPDPDLAVAGHRVTAPTCAPGFAPTSRGAKATKRVPIAPGQTVEFVPTGCAPKKTGPKKSAREPAAQLSEEAAVKRISDALVARQPAADLAVISRAAGLDDIALLRADGTLAFGIAWQELPGWGDTDYGGPLVSAAEVDQALARVVPACRRGVRAAEGFDCDRVRNQAADYTAIRRAENAVAAAAPGLTRKIEDVARMVRGHPAFGALSPPYNKLSVAVGDRGIDPTWVALDGLATSRLHEIAARPASDFEAAALRALRSRAEQILRHAEGNLSSLRSERRSYERAIADNARYAVDDPGSRTFYEQNTADLQAEIAKMDAALNARAELVREAREALARPDLPA